MKQEALLLDKPEDFRYYGVNPNAIEEWEDGVRDTSESNHFEWWYFDCMLDDNTKVVIQFLSKNGRTFSSNKFHPTIFYKVTTPDGRQIDKELHIQTKDIQWSKETCDVHFGKHSVCGNLKEYKIHIDLIDGMGADLTLKSTSKPYRPGTSYFQFGTPEQYYTWLCVRLYEDLTDGIISKAEYFEFRNSYTKIIEDKQDALLRVKKEMKQTVTTGTTERNWVTLFKQYENIEELNRRVLMSLVDRILIHENHAIEIVFKYNDEYQQTLEYVLGYSEELAIAG